MATKSSEILQEYLIQLGYKTDIASFKKFEDSLGKAGKSIFKVGGFVAGVVATLETASAAFAYSMRKTYFASELASSSVKSLNAIDYAGKQVGISSEAMVGSVENMARAVRSNPGLQSFLESLGVPVKGRDMSDVMVDLVKATNQMPEFQAIQVAGMFGIDPDTLHMMREHMDEFVNKSKEQREIWKSFGVDLDEGKETLKGYASDLDYMGESFEAVGTKVMMHLSGPMADIAKTTKEWTMDFSKWIDEGGIDRLDAQFEELQLSLTDFFEEVNSDNGILEKSRNLLTDYFEYYFKFLDRLEGIPERLKKRFGDIKEDVKDIYEGAVGKTTDLIEKSIGGISGVYEGAVGKTTDLIEQAAESGKKMKEWTGEKAKSAEEFVRQILPGARETAAKLNVPVEAVIGQAGLESGWGKKTSGAFNYFGMKAGKGYTGPTADIATHEVIGGKRVAMTDKFRAYASAEEGMAGHREFISRERYKGVRGAETPEQYFAGLKSGGYATDPEYIRKGAQASERAASILSQIEKASGPVGEAPVLPLAFKPAEETRLGGGDNSKSVQMSQTTNINVTGSGADGIAQEIIKKQDRVNGDLLRNMKGAVT